MLRGQTKQFNRGEVSSRALVRSDVERIHNSAALMTNFMPVRLGPMVYRPGTAYLGGALEAGAVFIPFIASTLDTALLEFGNNILRIWVDDEVLSREYVTTAIANPTFATLSGWTDNSGTGSNVFYIGGLPGIGLYGNESTRAELTQTISTVEIGSEHGIEIQVFVAPANLKIEDATTVFFDGEVSPGYHNFAFTPNSAITLTLTNSAKIGAHIKSIDFVYGEVKLKTSFTTGKIGVLPSEVEYIRYRQSADVMFLTCRTDNKPSKVQRRGKKSWSIVDIRVDDGPFELINNTDITLSPDALSGGSVGLVSSEAYFTDDHVGSLFKVVSAGQEVSASITGADSGTGSILVTGSESNRSFTVSITGTFVATVTLQRSIDKVIWTDVTSYTVATSTTHEDGLNNSELYYRLYTKAGDYTSGTADAELIYTSGSIEGICRAVRLSTSTRMYVQVLKPFGSTEATRDWYEGSWSEKNGYPSATDIHEGRLWLAGKNKIWGSVSDDYESFDGSIEGNSQAIQRTIGFGLVDQVEWLASAGDLVMGLSSDLITVKSNQYGDILTNNNCRLKGGVGRGAAPVSPDKVDGKLLIAQRSAKQLLEISLSQSINKSHSISDLNILNKDICDGGIKKIVNSSYPEPRVFVLLNDGSLNVVLIDDTEDILGWSRIKTDGEVMDVSVKPGEIDEDNVYITVTRNGGTYLEKFALFYEAQGGTISKHLDSFVQYTSPGTTITGLTHLEGETVYVWADGQDRGSYTVSSGQITVPYAWTDVTVGLRYVADYISNKVEQYGNKRPVMSKRKRIVDTSVILENYWPGSLQIGPTEAQLKSLPDIESGKLVDTTSLIADMDELPFEFDGETETDPRIYMRATGPCTILALTYGVSDESSDQASN